MRQEIAKGDVLQRIAGISFIKGAVLLVVFNILLPRADDPQNMEKVIQEVADARGGFWEADYLLLAVGIWAFMIGVVGVYRSISTGCCCLGAPRLLRSGCWDHPLDSSIRLGGPGVCGGGGAVGEGYWR